MTLTPTKPLGLYIHWPYCLSKCPYCDFNSFVGEAADMQQMEDAYLHEMQRNFERTQNHTLRSIFFGGGTPSLMPPSLTEKLIQKACALWEMEDNLEITLEANPSTAEANRFREFKNAGVNRLSLGVQSFEESALKFLGRGHSAKEALFAIDLAQKHFDSVSFDLIYALPEQTLEQWKRNLHFALTLGTDHLSLYQLTIEQGTAFAPRHKRGEFHLPEENLAAEMFALTNTVCTHHGMPRYEISNHARPGYESRHNLIYWRYEDYVGIGPGAHGRFFDGTHKIATEQHKAPDVWMNRVQNQGSGDIRTTHVSLLEQAEEALMVGLRLTEGVHIAKESAEGNHGECDEGSEGQSEGGFEGQCGVKSEKIPIIPFDKVIDPQALQFLCNEGFLESNTHILRTTEKGQLCLNGVLSKLLR